METGNYSAASSNMKLVHAVDVWAVLHVVQRGPQPAQAPPRCTKCNSSPINSQCTNHRTAV